MSGNSKTCRTCGHDCAYGPFHLDTRQCPSCHHRQVNLDKLSKSAIENRESLLKCQNRRSHRGKASKVCGIMMPPDGPATIYEFSIKTDFQNAEDRIVGKRRGKPGEMIREIAQVLLPIVTHYRRSFGTLDQVAGCASMAAREAINMAVYQLGKDYPTPQRSNGKKQSRPLPARSVKGGKVRGT